MCVPRDLCAEHMPNGIQRTGFVWQWIALLMGKDLSSMCTKRIFNITTLWNVYNILNSFPELERRTYRGNMRPHNDAKVHTRENTHIFINCIYSALAPLYTTCELVRFYFRRQTKTSFLPVHSCEAYRAAADPVAVDLPIWDGDTNQKKKKTKH